MDRVEDALAWLLTAVGLLLLLVAVAAGVGVYSHGNERARSEQTDRARTTAVLLADASGLPVDHASTAAFVPAPARWADLDGGQHDGKIDVPTGTPSGTRIPIWIDGRGERVPPPFYQASAVLDGAAVGVAVLGVGACVLAGVWMGLRRVIFVHNTRSWEREWGRIGPDWTSQQPT